MILYDRILIPGTVDYLVQYYLINKYIYIMISRRPGSVGRVARQLVCVRGTVSKLRVDVHYAVLKISLLFVREAIILGSQSSVLLKYITLLRNALYKSILIYIDYRTKTWKRERREKRKLRYKLRGCQVYKRNSAVRETLTFRDAGGLETSRRVGNAAS